MLGFAEIYPSQRKRWDADTAVHHYSPKNAEKLTRSPALSTPAPLIYVLMDHEQGFPRFLDWCSGDR